MAADDQLIDSSPKRSRMRQQELAGGNPEQNIRLLKWYYLLTPVFAFADFQFGIDIRITAPAVIADYRYYYYGICFLCAFFVFRSPLSASLFTLLECATNILLHVSSVMYPVALVADNIVDQSPPSFHFDTFDLLHFVLAGGVLLYSFYSNPLMRSQ